MEYKITYKPSAQKELSLLPKHEYFAIKSAIEALKDNPYPSGCKKTHGKFESCYRIRQGDYRVIYFVIKNEISIRIIKIGHRRDIYR